MSVATILVAVGLALLLAWSLRPQAPSPAPAGMQVVLPPIVLAGVSRESAEGILGRLQPTISPLVSPPGWRLEWPSVEIPTDFGTAKLDLPPVDLPFVPYHEALQYLRHLRPQVVNTEAGLAIQVTATIPT